MMKVFNNKEKRDLLFSIIIILFFYSIIILAPSIIDPKTSLFFSFFFALFGIFNPKRFSYCYIIYLITYRTLIYFWEISSYLDYIIIITPLLLLLFQIISIKYMRNFVPVIFYIIIVYFVLNGILLSKELLIIIREVIYIGNGIFLFIYFVNNNKINSAHYKNLIKLIILLISIQIYFQIIEISGISSNFKNHCDFYSGSFGINGTGIMGLFCLSISIFIFIQIFRKKLNKKYSILLLILSLEAFIGEAKIYFIGLALSLLLLFIYFSIKIRGRIIKNFIMLIPMILLLFLMRESITNYFGYKISNRILFSQDFFYRIMFKSEYKSGGRYFVGRGTGLILAYETIDNNIISKMFGLGLGTGKIHKSRTLETSNELSENLYADVFYGLDLIIIQLGFIGVFLLIIIILYLFIKYKNLTLKNKPSIIYYSDFFISFLFVYFISFEYEGGWLSWNAFNNVFWIISSGLYKDWHIIEM